MIQTVRTVRIPKTVKVEALRRKLGDEEAQRILTVVFASDSPVVNAPKASPEQIQAGIDILTGNGARGRSAAAAKGFERFLLLNPRVTKRYLVWAKAELAPPESDEEPEPTPEPAVKRRRRKAAAVA